MSEAESSWRGALLELMQRLQHHSAEIQRANSHDRGYALGWRGATNTCLAALRAALNGGEWPLIERELVRTAAIENPSTRVRCNGCAHLQARPAGDGGCEACGCTSLAFARRETDAPELEPTKPEPLEPEKGGSEP